MTPGAYADDATIRRVLAHRSWAVVGLSPNRARPAYGVAAFLQRQGVRVLPVHPAGGEVLGQKVWRRLEEVPEPVEVVDIFRRADQAGAHVDEAIVVGARAVWLQLGVVDEAAAARARAAGLDVVMDRCPKIEWPRLGAA